MLARAQLPKSVNAIGDRIGLDYGINKKLATRRYVDQSSEETRLEYDQLKNSFYSLTEIKTKKAGDKDSSKLRDLLKCKNPLKLNAKIRKSLYKINTSEAKKFQYSTFEIIHQLWLQYVAKVLEDRDPLTLFKADLHGCKLKCTASRNPTLVGSEGIVVQETKNTFLVIKNTNRLMTLPKRESIFEFSIGENVYRIHGCNLLYTTQARSKLKYKQRKHQSNV